MASDDEVQAHIVKRTLHEVVAYPAHPPREESAEYRRVHHHLIVVLDEPCWICGVRNSTLNDPTKNPFGAKAMETHHVALEWALEGAADPAKVLEEFPDMGAADDPHLRLWLDSEGNMLVLCDVHHRDGYAGIHSITYPVWRSQRYEWDGTNLTDPSPQQRATGDGH